MKKSNYHKGNTEWYLEAFRNFENRLNGQTASDLHKLRKKALQSFEDLGFPTTRHEEWKYTNVSPLLDQNFEISEPYQPGLLSKDKVNEFKFTDLEDQTLVFVNGHFAAELSDSSAIPGEIEILSLQDAFKKNPDRFSEHFTKLAEVSDQSFISLNTAFVQDGTYINIPQNFKLEKPIHLIYLSFADSKPVVSFPRNLIIAGNSSEVSVIESFVSLGSGSYFSNAVSEIVLHENAKVERIKIQNESEQAFHIAALQARQARDSRFIDHNISLGSAITRNDINSEFKGENGYCELNGMYSGNHDQLLDNHTTIDHAVAHCDSNELYKGILDDKSAGVFNGKIYVRPDAQKTNAIQSNNCILLSDQATIDTKPQLEIFADDVKCTHGATIGQLNEDAYFYMRTRGIEKANARKLLIYAFASEVVDKIRHEPVRQRILDMFSDKLHTIKPE